MRRSIQKPLTIRAHEPLAPMVCFQQHLLNAHQAELHKRKVEERTPKRILRYCRTAPSM